MKSVTAFIFGQGSAIFVSLFFLASTSQSADTMPQERALRSHPVTNESVEAGLRKNREALRSSPKFQTNDAPTHLQLATILSQQGDPNGAIEEYEATLKLNPRLPEAYRGLGAVFIDKHEWQKAQEALQKSTALNPTDSLAFYWLGRSLIAQEQFSHAQKALVKATQLDPNNPEAHSDLGLALMALGYVREAEKAFKEAIRLQPDFAEAHHRLEQVHDAQKDSSQLIQSARNILQTLFRRE